jgi:hypothetical protein
MGRGKKVENGSWYGYFILVVFTKAKARQEQACKLRVHV